MSELRVFIEVEGRYFQAAIRRVEEEWRDGSGHRLTITSVLDLTDVVLARPGGSLPSETFPQTLFNPRRDGV